MVKTCKVIEKKPRPYQVEALEMALRQNTILCLPTGSGKTFIATIVLKEYSGSLNIPYKEGGKRAFFLVPTKVLVHQQAKAIATDTTFSVGRFSGDCRDKAGVIIDNWTKPYWDSIFDKYEVLVMTRKIFLDILISGHIKTSSIGVVIFDEAHHGAPNSKGKVTRHDYVCIMEILKAKGISNTRIIGLTASLINNKWVCDEKMDKMIATTEDVYDSKVFFPKTSKISDAKEIVWLYKVLKGWDLEFKSDLIPSYLADISSKIKCGPIGKNANTYYMSDEEILENAANPISMARIKSTFDDLARIYTNFGPWALLKSLKFVHKSYQREFDSICHFESLFNEVIKHIMEILKQLTTTIEKNLSLMSQRDSLLAGVPNKMIRLLELLYEFGKNKDSDPMSAIIFVERRLDAFVISSWLNGVSQWIPEFDFIKSDFTVGFSAYNPFPFRSCFKSKQEEIITKFRERNLNILVATSVLEEGLDINHCNCIIRYDEPKTYRAYVQSKGRARSSGAYFIFFAPEDQAEESRKAIELFRRTEQKLPFYKKSDDKISLSSQNDLFLESSTGAILPSSEAKSRVLFYCDHLPSDGYTTKIPQEIIKESDCGSNGRMMFQCQIILPKISPLHKEQIFGPWCPSQAEAVTLAYFDAVKILHKQGELDGSFRPLDTETLTTNLMKKYDMDIDRTELEEWREECLKMKKVMMESTVNSNKRKEKCEFPPKPGSKKKRRYYPSIFSDELKGYQSGDSHCWLYKISIQKTLDSETGRLGLICFNPLPLHEIEGKLFIYSTKTKLSVSLELIDDFMLKDQQLDNIRLFQEYIFTGCLKIGYNQDSGSSSIFFSPSVSPYQLLFTFLTPDSKIDYSLLTQTYNRRQIKPSDYGSLTGALISKNYGLNQKGLFYVEKVDYDMSPKSPFQSDAYKDYEDYYKRKYEITSIKNDQPLLYCYPTPKSSYFPCPPGSKDVQRTKFPDKVYLIPELCSFEYFSSMAIKVMCTIPAVTVVLNNFLNASAIRKRLCSEIGYGITEIPIDDNTCWNNKDGFTNFVPLKVELAEYVKPTKSIDLSFIICSKLESSNGEKIISKDSHQIINGDVDFDDDGNDDVSHISSYVESSEEKISNTLSHKLNIEEEARKPLHQNSPVVVKISNESKLFSNNSIWNLDTKKLTSSTQWSDKNVQLDRNLVLYLEEKLRKNIHRFKNINSSIEDNDYYDDEEYEIINNQMNIIQKTSAESIYKDKSQIYKYGLPIELVVEAFTTRKADSNLNLERLEIIGDSFLKYIVSTQLFLKMKDLNEARITCLKTKLISNFYLLHLGRSKGLAQLINDKSFRPKENWLPPFYSSSKKKFTEQEISDKSVADMIEALLGAHLVSLGEKAAIQFLIWCGMPLISTNDSNSLLNSQAYLPLFHETFEMENATEVAATMRKFSLWKLEQKLGYKFKRQDLLIEALTHPSYCRSHFNSYQRLEFLGDAVLDYLITVYIFDHRNYQHLTPGEVTIIRQALVNNDYFATLSLVNGFDKFIFHLSHTLYVAINEFRHQLSNADLLGDNKIRLGSFLLDSLDMDLLIEAPKALGDIFESIAGAIYLDSGNSLSTVWKIYSKFLANEIEFFCANVPKSPALRLFEAFPNAVFVGEKMENEKRKRLNLIVNDWSFKVDHVKLFEDEMTKRAEKHVLILSALNKLAR